MSDPQWMTVWLNLPADEARALLLQLREKAGYRTATEHACASERSGVLVRNDGARVVFQTVDGDARSTFSL